MDLHVLGLLSRIEGDRTVHIKINAARRRAGEGKVDVVRRGIGVAGDAEGGIIVGAFVHLGGDVGDAELLGIVVSDENRRASGADIEAGENREGYRFGDFGDGIIYGHDGDVGLSVCGGEGDSATERSTQRVGVIHAIGGRAADRVVDGLSKA